jgi:hypothetical protein
MQIGDLVRCDPWVNEGRYGIIVEMQAGDYCVGAYVLFEIGIKLVRMENLKVKNESR